MSQINAINVVVIKEGVVDQIYTYPPDAKDEAEKKFLDECESNISNWDEYTPEDRNAILDQGFEEFGTYSSICISHSITEE